MKFFQEYNHKAGAFDHLVFLVLTLSTHKNIFDKKMSFDLILF